MKKSKINFEITLDEDSVPEKIFWKADDHETPEWQESKAVSLSIWDPNRSDALVLDLWTKEMSVDEMKKFYVNLIGSASNALLSSTGDEHMSVEINSLCERLVKYLQTQ